MVRRIINPLKSDSFFIFGARGTGKSTFVNEQFLKNQSAFMIDLLDYDSEEKYSKDPQILERELDALKKKPDWVFIDEIQKVPKLLDLVHKLIEKKKQKFILTGSSSRKLKKQGANLLAGRAFINQLFPLTYSEVSDFQLTDLLAWGGLPKVVFSDSDQQRLAFLKSYVQVYLKEEIRVEQLVRDLDPFRDFLEVAAQMNGKVLNYSKVAKDVGVSDKTIHSYFQILQDTYIGFYLPAFHRSIRKSQKEHPKFYFFDTGVKRQLDRSIESKLISGTIAYGDCFEHFLILEIQRLASYHQKNWTFSYFQTKENREIDLIISLDRKTEILVEIKSASKIDPEEFKYLNELSLSFNAKKVYVLSQDVSVQKYENIFFMPWQAGLKELFSA
jgi:predicted AAA+ superfamily ATPase